MERERFACLDSGQDVGEIVLDAGQVHFIKDDEDGRIPEGGRHEDGFKEGRHDIAVC